MNDTTLNDWRGVIDEELEEQKEERENREAEVQALIDRVQTLESHWKEDSSEAVDRVNREELDSLRKELRSLVREVTGSSLSTRRSSTSKVSANCPCCDSENSYGQYQMKDNIREIRCSECGVELVSTFTVSDRKAVLEKPKLVIEELDCPSCGSVFHQELSTAHRAKADHRCKNCESLVRIKRNSDRIKLRVVSQKLPISEEIITRVKEQMPEQPWPTGIHKQVQANLGITAKTYQRAIDDLIVRGVFKRQIDGVLYELGDEIPASNENR